MMHLILAAVALAGCTPLASAQAVVVHSGVQYTLQCLPNGEGNTTLFDETMQLLKPGDVVLVEPCDYKFGGCDTGEAGGHCIGKLDYGCTAGVDENNFAEGEGITIKGMGMTPAETVLRTKIEQFPVNAVFENLTFLQTGGTIYKQGGLIYGGVVSAILFRNCVLRAPSENYFGSVACLGGKHNFIDTKIINTAPKELYSGRRGMWLGAEVAMMRSEVINFNIGIMADKWTEDSIDNFKIHETDIYVTPWRENIECCTEAGCTDANCPLLSQNKNTPNGAKVIISFKDNSTANLLGGGGFDESDELKLAKILPLKISFPQVETAGHTFMYKYFSAHPSLPKLWNKVQKKMIQYVPGIAEPQYYRFDSTAVLDTKNTVKISFLKKIMDENFTNSTNIKAFVSLDGKTWEKGALKMKIKKGKYEVRFLRKDRLNGLIAFGETEEDLIL